MLLLKFILIQFYFYLEKAKKKKKIKCSNVISIMFIYMEYNLRLNNLRL